MLYCLGVAVDAVGHGLRIETQVVNLKLQPEPLQDNLPRDGAHQLISRRGLQELQKTRLDGLTVAKHGPR